LGLISFRQSQKNITFSSKIIDLKIEGFEPATLQKEQCRLSLIVTPHATRQTQRIGSAQLVGLKIFLHQWLWAICYRESWGCTRRTATPAGLIPIAHISLCLSNQLHPLTLLLLWVELFQPFSTLSRPAGR
jgi:hypothetical protein